MGANAAKLFFVHRRKLFQRFVTARGQRQLHLAAIGAVLFPHNQPSADKAVDKADGTVVTDLQALGQFANPDTMVARRSLDGQQRLVVLRPDSCAMRRLLTEPQKLP